MKTPEEKTKLRIESNRQFDSSLTLLTHRLKKTPHRLAIFDILREHREPISLEKICALLSQRLPQAISYTGKPPNLATVYRTLATFEEAKLIRRIDGNYELS